jgi:hypothetical protein
MCKAGQPCQHGSLALDEPTASLSGFFRVLLPMQCAKRRLRNGS